MPGCNNNIIHCMFSLSEIFLLWVIYIYIYIYKKHLVDFILFFFGFMTGQCPGITKKKILGGPSGSK